MLKSEIAKKNWLKNWSGQWGTCFASFYGDLYFKEIKKYTGKGFKTNLVFCEPAARSNFLVKEEKTEYAKVLVKMITTDETLLKKWCKETIKNTNGILKFIDNLLKKKKVSHADFLKLKDWQYRHVPTNFFIKRMADYLPQSILDEYYEEMRRVRLYTEDVYNKVDEVIQKILKQISITKEIDIKTLNTLTHVEVDKVLKTGKLPRTSELRERKGGFALLYINGKEKKIIGEDFIDLKQDFIRGLEGSNNIKGSVAFKGIMKGTVKIVFDPKNAKYFKKGDILVTGMTRPEFLPIMEKAAAFVTDAGGILSHAAIVARELKKPCIIGTEIATKVLKDGDLVEVDANSGVVKILKRAK